MSFAWKYHLNHFILGSLDLLFPPRCGGCNRDGFRWCPECQEGVQLIREPVCESCGQPMIHLGMCVSCQRNRPPYREMRSWVVFDGPIRSALHQLKYYRNFSLGDTLAQQLFPFLQGFHWPIDCVIPVPLGRIRIQERGYNQVGMIALSVAYLGDWEYYPRALIRARETASQVGLTIKGRKENVLNAFRGDSQKVQGKVVLLIDDVATTGATIFECAKALREAGARDIYAFTIARASRGREKSI